MTGENRKNSKLDHAASVLQNLLKNGKSPLSEQFVRWRVWSSWSDIAGPEIAKHSQPVGFLQGTLYVWVDSGPRMQEMLFLAKPLKEKINEFVGKKWVRMVRFTQDRKSVPKPGGSAQAGELQEFIDKSVPDSGDEGAI